MQQGTIIVTFANIENKEDFLKECKVEASSIFKNEDLTLQLPLYFTADAEDSELVMNVADGDPVEVEDEEFDLDEL